METLPGQGHLDPRFQERGRLSCLFPEAKTGGFSPLKFWVLDGYRMGTNEAK